LSRHFLDRYDVPVDSDHELLITAGSKAAIYMTFLSVLDPGDEVLIPEPAWVSYTEQVKLCHGKPVGIPHDFPLSRIEEMITPRTKAIVINTPHNPSGYVYKRAELEKLLALARQHNLWLMSDEAYSEFVLDDSFVSLGSLDREKTHSILFNSVSKNHGISGWRLGYVIAHPRLISQILKVNQHLVTCPATILEHYVATYFDEILEITAPQIRAVVEKRKQVERLLDEIGLDYMKGTGTFYFFVSTRPSKLGSEEFCTRFRRDDLRAGDPDRPEAHEGLDRQDVLTHGPEAAAYPGRRALAGSWNYPREEARVPRPGHGYLRRAPRLRACRLA
jgi:aspartate aminotransferase/aminotransferase